MAAQPGEEEAPGIPSSFPVPKGATESWRGTFLRGKRALSCRRTGLDWLIRRKFYCEDGEALELVAQSYGCLMAGSIQGKPGWSFEQPGLLGGIPGTR